MARPTLGNLACVSSRSRSSSRAPSIRRNVALARRCATCALAMAMVVPSASKRRPRRRVATARIRPP
eukprot:791463-Pleurochrysis_carterae.AAC.2